MSSRMVPSPSLSNRTLRVMTSAASKTPYSSVTARPLTLSRSLRRRVSHAPLSAQAAGRPGRLYLPGTASADTKRKSAARLPSGPDSRRQPIRKSPTPLPVYSWQRVSSE